MGILVTEANSKRFKIADEGMSSIKDIKLNHNESFFIDLFSKSSKIFAINNSIQVIIGSFPRYILEIVSFGMIVGIIVYMSMNEYNSSEIIPIVSVYAMSGYKLMPALQQIYVSIATMKYNISAVDILINDFKDDYNIEKKQNLNSSRMFFLDKLNLNNLYFSYPSRKENVINGLDLSIGSGSIVGIAGKTGSGKTTLVDIILGLLTKKSGEFNIDGSEVLNNNVRSWQKNIGYVPQNIYIIDDTIANNIAFSVSKEDIDFNKVEFVAKLAKLDDFILNLPDKYETNVGERGVCISGGQRQRIGIARALYNDPLVLVLDEATSALDGITEREILNSIHSISRKITIIMIAHRISTLKRCDAIHIMDEGRIIDSGTYKYLMSNNEYFRKMSSY
jgi:ABC-type multidrug transport system fused ATPase/permease subunit